LEAERGVDDIAARQSKVQPTARSPIDLFSHSGREGDHVMVESLLKLPGPLRESFRVGAGGFNARFERLGLVGRHRSVFGQRSAGQQFDLEPNTELVLLTPDFPHGRA